MPSVGVQTEHELVCHGVQTAEVTTDDKSIQFPEPQSADVRIDAVSRLSEAAQQAEYSLDSESLSSFVSNGSVSLQSVGTFHMHNSSCSWTQYYLVLTFLLNGYLHADYFRLYGSLIVGYDWWLGHVFTPKYLEKL